MGKRGIDDVIGTEDDEQFEGEWQNEERDEVQQGKMKSGTRFSRAN